MNSYIDTINCLPREFIFFKSILNNRRDPIKKEVFNFKDINYLIKNIKKFPVSSNQLYRLLESDCDKELYLFLFENYLHHRSNYDLIINHMTLRADYQDIKAFIELLFEHKPMKSDIVQSKVLWIYPKLTIQSFLCESVFNRSFNNFLFKKSTLNKLISIIAHFTKYEYDNFENHINNNFEDINYPTLLLANIKLYEKGFFEIFDDSNNIEVRLNIKGKDNQLSIFTRDEYYLKKTILNMINKNYGNYYTMNDFL